MVGKLSGKVCELTRRAFVWEKGAPQIPPLRFASVGMGVELWGGIGCWFSTAQVPIRLRLG
jgi:hypothetical protein